jgi:hypothetical protein
MEHTMAPSILRRKTVTATTLLLLVLSLSATLAFGQPRSSSLTIQVRPEMLLTPGASSVQLAVRLAPSVQAQVWRADTCAAAPADAFVVTQSGRTQISVAALGTGSKVCAASTDRTLLQSLDLSPGSI